MAKQMHGVDDRRKRAAKLMAEHGQEFVFTVIEFHQRFGLFLYLALEPSAFGNVANVALCDLDASGHVGVADELDVHRAACLVSSGQVFVTDVALLLQRSECGSIGIDVGEHADLPELLAQEIGARATKQLLHEGIDVEDLPGDGVENENSISGGFEEPPIAHLGQGRIG
jgi:hypothetical protein